jgi:hypothetical protein
LEQTFPCQLSFNFVSKQENEVDERNLEKKSEPFWELYNLLLTFSKSSVIVLTQ